MQEPRGDGNGGNAGEQEMTASGSVAGVCGCMGGRSVGVWVYGREWGQLQALGATSDQLALGGPSHIVSYYIDSIVNPWSIPRLCSALLAHRCM